MLQHTCEHCTDTFAHANKDMTAPTFKSYNLQTES